MSLLLRDATNLPTATGNKRACFDRSVAGIVHHTVRQDPRGDCALGSKYRWNKEQENPVSDSVCNTLRQILNKHNPAFEFGKERIDNYIERNITTEMQKAIAIQLFSTATKCWGKGILEAASLAADVTGVSAFTIRKWASEYYLSLVDVAPDSVDLDDIGSRLSSNRGKFCKLGNSLLCDEEFRLKAREFVRANAYVRGEPNMTSQAFRNWIQSTSTVTICRETARSWLHNLGFSQKNHHKEVYFDGHERDDVILHRRQFVTKLLETQHRCMFPNNEIVLNKDERPLIIVHHDESTFYANADQTNYWSDGTVTVLKQKSLGQSIMVSDFIEEKSGDYLNHDGKMARVLLETQSEGYFDSCKFLAQVDGALDIFEAKYPYAQGLFLFDNAPCHKKCPDDALKVDSMNVRPGGKQPVMRDTVFNGEVQTMVLPDGRPKGLKLVLEERGVNTVGMNAEKLRDELGKHDDFRNVKTLLQEKIELRGHLCMYIPKFHCELNAIERCWCHAKKYSRAHANGTITRLRTVIPKALDTCTPDLIAKFFCTVRDYIKAYDEGHTCNGVEEAVKLYKSHRRVFNINT